MVPLSWYLALSAVLFTIGVAGVLIQGGVEFGGRGRGRWTGAAALPAKGEYDGWGPERGRGVAAMESSGEGAAHAG